MGFSVHCVRQTCVFMSVSMLAALMAGCGGGSGDSAASAATAAVPVEEGKKVADVAKSGLKKALRLFMKKGVIAIALSPDGASVVVAGADGIVRLLDAVSLDDFAGFKGNIGAAVTGVVFSNDRKMVGAVARDSAVHVCDVATSKKVFQLHGHAHPIQAMAQSADGSLFATAGEETRVMLWRRASGKLEKVFDGHTEFVNTVAFSGDGKLLASGDAAGRILIWDIASGRLIHTLRGHADEIHGVVFKPDGRLIASVAADGKVLLWDLAIGHWPVHADA